MRLRQGAVTVERGTTGTLKVVGLDNKSYLF